LISICANFKGRNFLTTVFIYKRKDDSFLTNEQTERW